MSGRAASTKLQVGDLALSVGHPKTQPPHGWNWIELNSLAEMASGHTPSRNHPEYWGGAIKWMCAGDARFQHGGVVDETAENINELGLQKSAAVILPKDTVCLARTGASIGYAVRLGTPMATNQGFVNWICGPNLDPKFYQYILVAEGDFLRRIAYGAAHHTIYFPEVKAFHICVPPLSEQQRIVGILDEAFEGIATAKANAEKNLQNARALFRAAVRTLSTDSEQASWEKSVVAKIAAQKKGAMRTGPFGSQLLHSEFIDEGIAVLGIDNAVANEFRWGKTRCITPEKYQQLKRYRVYPSDVVITIMGTCGRCAIIPDEIPTAINSKHLCCITLDQTKCLPGYLHAYFLYHPIAQEYLAKRAKGLVMAGLNMGIIKELPVLLPPIKRQSELIVAVDSLREETQRLATIYERKLAALDDLKKSLLHQAFSGNL